MSDVFKDYKKQKVRRNITIISLSLMFALSLNFFLFSSSVWQKIQTSVKNYGEQPKVVNKDIYIEAAGTGSDILDLKIWSDISKASELSASFLFDPESMKLVDLYSDNKEVEITKVTNVPGIYFVSFKYKTPTDLKSWTTIWKILVNKIKKDWKIVINMAQTHFTSDSKTYELTNASFEF